LQAWANVVEGSAFQAGQGVAKLILEVWVPTAVSNLNVQPVNPWTKL
jgi:hypothetical protein